MGRHVSQNLGRFGGKEVVVAGHVLLFRVLCRRNTTVVIVDPEREESVAVQRKPDLGGYEIPFEHAQWADLGLMGPFRRRHAIEVGDKIGGELKQVSKFKPHPLTIRFEDESVLHLESVSWISILQVGVCGPLVNLDECRVDW